MILLLTKNSFMTGANESLNYPEHSHVSGRWGSEGEDSDHHITCLSWRLPLCQGLKCMFCSVCSPAFPSPPTLHCIYGFDFLEVERERSPIRLWTLQQDGWWRCVKPHLNQEIYCVDSSSMPVSLADSPIIHFILLSFQADTLPMVWPAHRHMTDHSGQQSV